MSTFVYGLRGHDLGRMEAPALADAVLAAGFESLQLAPRKALREFEGAQALEPGLARAAGRAFRDRGVRVAILGCYVEVLHPDREQRRRELARLRESLELCEAFGSTVVATEIGKAGLGPVGGDRSGLVGEIVDSLGELCLLAGRLGLTLALEPVWDHGLPGPTEAAMVQASLDLPGLGFLLDPVNLVPNAGLSEPAAPALEAIRILGRRIVAVHAKDFRIEGGQRRIVPCGQGQMPWAPILEGLVGLRADMDLILEDQAAGLHGPGRDWLETQVSSSPWARGRTGA